MVGVGVGVGVGAGQFRLVGENVIGMVLIMEPLLGLTKEAEPEKLLLPVRGPSDWVTQVLKVPLEGAVKGIELLMVIGVPDDGITVIS